MANTFAAAFRSFWHDMTSNDRHANHDSPYRTGSHMPVNQNRHAPLTSIATSAQDSQQDLSAYDGHEAKRPSVSSPHPGTSSPNRPYSPGMRSVSSPKVATVHEDSIPSPGEIQMQNFADGAPPPPPPSHSWKKIDRWAEKNYTELFDQLGEGCSQNDINELEHELDMTLPQDVRESLALHDGQERGGRPTGIIFGCMLLDCEEIVQEMQNWKTVNEQYLTSAKKQTPYYPLKSMNGAASSSASPKEPQNNKFWRQELQDKQDSQPPKAIQKAYAHPSWVPLARDWGGNNIAVDLAPGPTGKWGQVILFGRDFDCKYVVAKSWAHFLSIVADDLSTDRVVVDEESGDLKLKEFKTETVEPAYIDILRWRADQKYGRKAPVRNNRAHGMNGNANGVNAKSNSSPYNSPQPDDGGRGRSPQRFSRAGTGSPRPTIGSPLARVQEELQHPQPIATGGDHVKDFARDIEPADSSQTANHPYTNQNIDAVKNNGKRTHKLVDAPTPIQTSFSPTMPFASAVTRDKLVDVPTPISAGGRNDTGSATRREFPTSRLTRVGTGEENKENKSGGSSQGESESQLQGQTQRSAQSQSQNLNQNQNHPREVKGLGVDSLEDEMKNVAI